MSNQYELALRQYIAAFDGTNDLSPAEFKSRFDNLYHKDLIHLPKDEKIIGCDGMRDEVFQLYSNLYASGLKVTLIYFRRIGLDNFDIQLRLDNGKHEWCVWSTQSQASMLSYLGRLMRPSH
jgi:hypothetical protein